jgi:hypothetical protein
MVPVGRPPHERDPLAHQVEPTLAIGLRNRDPLLEHPARRRERSAGARADELVHAILRVNGLVGEQDERILKVRPVEPGEKPGLRV